MAGGFDLLKLADDAKKSIGDAAKAAGTFAGQAVDAAGEAAGNVIEGVGGVAAQTGGAISGALGAVGDAAGSVVQNAQAVIGERKEKELREYEEVRMRAIGEIEIDSANAMLEQLGDSPVELTRTCADNIKEVFPIPREQTVLWADAEFDLRPSGVAVTDCGVFVRSDVSAFGAVRGGAEGGNKPVLTYYQWEDFEAAWCSTDDEGNVVLGVDERCRKKFMQACRDLAEEESRAKTATLAACETVPGVCEERQSFESAVGTGAMAPIASESKYAYDHASRRNPAGHGEMAESANNMLDRLHGNRVQWKGRDNAKGGADRIVGGASIQTKYYKTWRGSLNAAFDSHTGNYLYKDMQLEVPKDQYEKVLEGFRRKIEAGKVEGVSDPALAEQYVRRGRLTYRQAVNITKPGTIESLLYDAGTGAVVCTSAFGITFVATVFNAYRSTENLEESIQAGVVAGTQVFGTAFAQHMLASQISRTGLADALIAPSQLLVQKMGYRATQVVVNGLRTLSGKAPIYGAAASKQLAKVLRGNAVTAAVTMAVFSAPEVYRLVNNKMSGSQFAKNMGSVAGSVAGGAAGMVAAGAVASKAACAAGTVVAPGVGTAVGIVGGFVGGVVGSAVAGAVGDVFIEDDADAAARFFNAMVSVLACEYMLDSHEVSCVVEKLNGVEERRIKELFEEMRCADNQENFIRDFLTPLFDEVVAGRDAFNLPSPEQINASIGALAEEYDELFDEGGGKDGERKGE